MNPALHDIPRNTSGDLPENVPKDIPKDIPRDIRSLLRHAAARLTGSATPGLDAEALLGHALHMDRGALRARPEHLPEPEQIRCFEDLLEQRARQVPVAYLTGQKEFWSLAFKVDARVLVPRPETEHLVEEALRHPFQRALDLGTGCGAVAVALAKERPDRDITATDLSADALRLAEENAARHACLRMEFRQSDWFADLRDESFDLIVSNPPYVAHPMNPQEETPGELAHEPAMALFAGAQGLDALSRIIPQARPHLRHAGSLLLEHGHDQGAAVRELLRTHGYRDIHTTLDLAGHERVTQGSRDDGGRERP